ncbi:ankyrin repeat domain-containing protein SOWAHC-like [Pempheris klunzingeri]|uniref:ankyrin repeat domain-containing protein SOWAHC-like n=1 Tax=Pempheris klunzingeri TaxID=3127111 RepID=UPI00397F481F
MGNRQSFRRELRESRRSRLGAEPHIPQITVIEASPLPAEGSMFSLPEPAHTHTQALVPEGPKDTEQVGVMGGHRPTQLQSDDRGGEERLDTHSLSGSDGNGTPKGSRKHFIEVMMNSSPQVRRSMVFCSSGHLSSRSDSDSASLVSYNLDDDRTSATLDPLEHEWMMCASDGEWDSLCPLLSAEPSLVLRKDFVTGFTCLHWAAKHGKPELIALIINFSKQHNIPISVDVRSNTGYTPLHVAAMHDHMEVVKLLVGAYSADVEMRDYSGRKACQYLTDSVSVDIQDIIGAYERSDPEGADHRDGGRWRFSKVLQSNLRPRRLLNPGSCDCEEGADGPREKPLRRKSSLSRLKPKLQRLRERTSQIVHSTSFRDPEDPEGSLKSRPKTHLFG